MSIAICKHPDCFEPVKSKRMDAEFCSSKCKVRFHNSEQKAVRQSMAERLLADQGGLCFYCFNVPGDLVWNQKRREWVDTQLHLEHVVPKAFRRDNAPTNLVAACSICNLVKGSRVFDSVEAAREYIEDRRREKGYGETAPTGQTPSHPSGAVVCRNDGCENPLTNRRIDATFCSPECRIKFHNAAMKIRRMPNPDTATDREIRAALRPYLTRAYRRGHLRAGSSGRFRIRLKGE